MFNGTLIVQILHFCIGYYLLTYILLKPALALLQEQEMQEQQLNYDIVELKNKLAEHEAGKKQVWQECLRTLLQGKPAVEKQLQHAQPHVPVIPQALVSEQEEKELVDRVARRSMQHVMHESRHD